MVEAIKEFFFETVGREWCVFLCSMLPVIELRGAIPMGFGFNLPIWLNYLLSVLGNMLPVPFILLFINRLRVWMTNSKVRFFNKFANWLNGKIEKNRAKIEKYSFWGVCLFVAIPLPATGAWTGALVASAIGMKFWKALLSAFIGVCIAGIVVSLISYGVVAIFA